MPSSPPSRCAWLTSATSCLLVAGGCGDAAAIRPGDIRVYAVPRPPEALMATAAAPRTGGPAIRYEVPAGWTDRGGGGMRLTTLAIGDPAAGHEVTVIPAAGTLRGNVERWQGQLGETDAATRDAAVTAALDAAETIEVDGTKATVVLLAAAAGGQAILAAMIPLDDAAALFVKFKGDAEVARRERANFNRFVASLRWREGR